MPGPNTAQHNALINWSYRGQGMSGAPASMSAPPPPGFTVVTGSPFRNGSGEIQVDILRRTSDGATIIVPRGTVPSITQSLAANTMLPQMTQLRGSALRGVLDAINDTSGRIELVGHSQGAAHAFGIAYQAISADSSLASRMTVTTYNPAPMGNYNASIEAAIGGITTSYRSVWVGAGVGPAGYRPGDIISLLGPIPGRVYEYETYVGPGIADALTLHNPSFFLDMDPARLRDVSAYAHRGDTRLMFMTVSILASLPIGDPGSLTPTEALGRALMGLGGGISMRGLYQAGGDRSIDLMLLSLVNNFQHQFQDDPGTLFLLNRLESEIIELDLNDPIDNARAGFIISTIGAVLTTGEYAGRTLVELINETNDLADRLEAQARLYGVDLRGLGFDPFTVLDNPVITFFTPQGSWLYNGQITIPGIRGGRITFPASGESQGSNSRRNVFDYLRNLFSNPGYQLLNRWPTYSDAGETILTRSRMNFPSYINVTVEVDETDQNITNVTLDDTRTVGPDRIDILVSSTDLNGTGPIPVGLVWRRADSVVLTLPGGAVDPVTGQPAPNRSFVFGTSNVDQTASHVMGLVRGEVPLESMSDDQIAALVGAESVALVVGDNIAGLDVPTAEAVDAAVAEAEREQAVSRFKLESLADLYRFDTSNLFSAFGSVLGSRLGGDDLLLSAIGSAALETLLSNIGEALEAAGAPGDQSGGASLMSIITDQLGTEFFHAIKSQGVGAVSSWLVSHVIDALGLEGTVGEISSSVGGAVISQIINNLIGPPIWADAAGNILRFGEAGQVVATGGQVGAVGQEGLQVPPDAQSVSRPWNLNITQAAGAAFASYLGGRLADAVKTFDSQYGQVGAAIGQTYGSMNATAFLAIAGVNPATLVIAAIAVAAWKLIGGFIGSMFGASKSYASVEFNDRSDQFSVGGVTSRRGGSKEGALSLAGSVADLLNNVVDATGASINGLVPVKQEFGMRNNEYVYWTEDFRSADVSEVLRRGYYDGLIQLLPHLVGGDVFAKRALLGNLTAQTRTGFEMEALLGDLTIAGDFARYLSSPVAVEMAIQAEPDSAFAAGWLITLARAQELGLDKRAFTDWLGGWGAFTDVMLDGVLDGMTWSAGLLEMEVDAYTNDRAFVFLDYYGDVAGVSGDTIDSASKSEIHGTAGADSIVVVGSTLQVGAGLTVQDNRDEDAEGVTLPYEIRVAAVIDGGAGDDLIRGGDLGNDLLGGEGNDVLVGGKLDDWLFGQEGDDVLFAGDVANTGFAVGDKAAENIAVAVAAGNGDYLDGGAGNDRLYGGKGSDWLNGGAGADRLVGGAGGDILQGGEGDDHGLNGAAGLLGGAGADQYVFGFGDGADVVFDDADPNAVEGTSTGDSLSSRIWAIDAGTQSRNWAGDGDYAVDGSVRGGQDAIAFGAGVTMANIRISRDGQNLVIALMETDGNGIETPSGDVLTVRDWFESSRRVEWLRFADGEEFRIGDMTSFLVGTGASDVILGTNSSDFLYGGAGNDELRGLGGGDFGNGGSGDDFVAGDGDNDWVMGGSGDDQVMGGTGHDTVFGDGGEDRLFGGDGSDLMSGGRGADYIVGGAGDDIFRYERGDGQDTLLDDLVDNWDIVWVNGVYQNGYALQPDGTVTLNGEVHFDGSRWVGSQYDWDDATKTLRRHKGAVGEVIGRDSGTDSLEFGVGIDIQDLSLRRTGADLEIGVGEDGGAGSFDSIADRILVKDWYSGSAPIENFVFASTGRHALDGMTLTGGTDGVDTLSGGTGKDWITGNAGNDVINGGAGDDILNGGAGDDVVKGGDGADILYGGAGDDLLNGGSGADIVFGGSGRDIVSYDDGVTTGSGVEISLDFGGATGGDTLVDVEGLEGTGRDDRLTGDGGDNMLRGGKGADVLFGGAGDDVFEFNRGDGSDVVREGVVDYEEVISASGVVAEGFALLWESVGGDPELDPPGGHTYSYSLTLTRVSTGEVIYQSRNLNDFQNMGPQAGAPPASQWPSGAGQWAVGYGPASGGRVVHQVIGEGDGGVDTLQMGEGIAISDLMFQRVGDDLKVTLSATDQILLKGQNDADTAVEEIAFADGLVIDLTTLVLAGETATAGADLMIGGAGNDVLTGLGGADMLSGGAGNDALSGGDGDDILEGGAGADVLDGGSDRVSLGQGVDSNSAYGDTVRYTGSDAGVTVDLAMGWVFGGHANSDVIVKVDGVSTIENATGSNWMDFLYGDGRDNRLSGLGGNDIIRASAGNDVLSGGAGNDQLFGEDGDDALTGESGNDSLSGDAGRDLLSGGEGDDSLSGGEGDDILSGDAGADILHGDLGDDQIGGGDGADQLFGDDGADVLAGGEGDDVVDGGAGADVLSGDGGNDLLNGGDGDDAYQFDSRSGSDLVVDASGANRIVIGNIDASRLWLSRSGDDLVLTVIGGSSVITLQGYYAASPTTLVREIVTTSGSLFLAHAEPLILAMAGAVPAQMPAAIAGLLDGYWHAGGKALPTVQDVSLSMDEDTVLTGSVGAVDHDDNIVGYSVLTGPLFGQVTVNGTGAWTYTPDAGAHGEDSFELSVTDADGNTATQIVTVEVISLQSAPENLTSTPLSVLENSANGAVVGQFSSTDDDDPAAVGSYSLVDNAGGRFSMTTDGQLRVANGAALNYEAAATHTITVRVTDSTGLSTEKAFTVSVGNVNERPNAPVLGVQTNSVVQEGVSLNGLPVATYSVTDPDGDPTTLSVNSGWFQVNGNALNMANVTLDFESRVAAGATLVDSDGDGAMEAVYSASVTASDGALTSGVTIITIRIEDANETPTDIVFAPSTTTIVERDRPQSGADMGAVLLGVLSSTDADLASSIFSQNHVFTVSDSRFEIVNGNQLRLKAGAALDYEAGSTVSLSVTVTDMGGLGLSRTETISFTVVDGIDYLYGGASGETLTGQVNGDVIYGYGGADTVNAGSGADSIYGGDGNDVLNGEAGADSLWGDLGDDSLNGGSGADVLRGGDGVDVLSGGDDGDQLYGDGGADQLYGGLGDDLLQGGDGADLLHGESGADQVFGGIGDDTLVGGAGGDAIHGGDGVDTVTFAAAGAGVIVDLVTGGTGGDAAGDTYSGVEVVIGSAYADTLRGTAGGDRLEGGAGDDYLVGGLGPDVLLGGDGNDILDAGADGDDLDGGAGADRLIGGTGSDVFRIGLTSGADVIENYDPLGADIDTIGYRDNISRENLWFERVGNNLLISVVGTSVQTTVKDWYVSSPPGNFRVDFIIAGSSYTVDVNAESLVALMAGYAKPASQAAFNTLLNSPSGAFANQWRNLWYGNGAPVIGATANQTVLEDGTRTVTFTVIDDITPYGSLSVSAASSNGAIIGAPTVSGPDGSGQRTVTLVTQPNASGTVTITLTATDPGGLYSTRSFTVDVTPQADAPQITVAHASGTTLDSGQLALNIQAALVDQDGSETLEIRISGMPAALSLNQGVNLGGGVWSLTPAQLPGLALLGPSTWSQNLTRGSALTITAISRESATGHTSQTSQTLAVPINARPTDIVPPGSLAVSESVAGAPVANGTVVGTFSSVDPDGESGTFSLIDGAGGRFAISTAGVLTVANGALLDRESAGSHSIVVRVTDSGGLTRDETFVVAVNNVNEAPTAASITSQPVGLIGENTYVSGAVVANLAASDPDGTAPSFVVVSNPQAAFEVIGSQLRFKSGVSINYETLRDAGYSLTDVDGDGRYEANLSIVVRATDGSLNSGDTTVQIRVEDVNEAPADIWASGSFAVAEGAAGGTTLGSFGASDPDAGDGRLFSLIDSAGGRFGVSAAGVLSVANGGLLDYEAASGHWITVRATDGGGLVRDESFWVGVNNVNEAPGTPWIGSQPIVVAGENVALGGQVVATLGSTDPDGTAPAFALVSDPRGWFTISGSSVLAAPGLNLDFDALAAAGMPLSNVDGDGAYEVYYSASVVATDGAANSAPQTVTIYIEDANERPDITSQTFSMVESAPGAGQTLIGTMALSDPDWWSGFRDNRFSISGADAALFSINATTGQIYLQGSLNYENDTQKVFQVTVQDAANSALSETVDVVVNVTNANEAPYVQGYNSVYAYNYNSNPYGYITSLPGTVIDPDGDAITYTVTSYRSASGMGPDGGYYYVSGGTIYHYGNYSQYGGIQRSATDTLTIKATDPSGLSVWMYVTLSFQYIGTYPVIFDFDGNGLDLLSPEVSSVKFDHDGDGYADTTGWVGGADGLLVLDRDRNGRIDTGAELSFIDDLPGAQTDLEGLRAWDSNADGRLDAADAEFSRFQVWRDLNQDGVSQADELVSLTEAGVMSINLDIERTGAAFDGLGNAILGYADFTRSDGTTGKVGDVVLAYEPSAATEATVHFADDDARPARQEPEGGPAVRPSDETLRNEYAAAFLEDGEGWNPLRGDGLPLRESHPADPAGHGDLATADRGSAPAAERVSENGIGGAAAPADLHSDIRPVSKVQDEPLRNEYAAAFLEDGTGLNPPRRDSNPADPAGHGDLTTADRGGAPAAERTLENAPAPTDAGVGDAAPDRVDRASSPAPSPAQLIRQAMGDPAWRHPQSQGRANPAREMSAQLPVEADLPDMPEANIGSGVQAKGLEAHIYEGADSPSALDGNLALAARKRFQMIEAMAHFTAQTDGAMDSNWRGMLERRTPAMLTALPDIGARQ